MEIILKWILFFNLLQISHLGHGRHGANPCLTAFFLRDQNKKKIKNYTK